MSIPPAGFVHAELLGNHSQQSPLLARAQVTVTGTTTIKIQAARRDQPLSTVVVSLASTPSADVTFVTAVAGPTADTITINVYDATYTLAHHAATVNMIAVFGSSLGQ